MPDTYPIKHKEYCFSTNKSNLEQISSHLYKCDTQFSPRLSTQVNLDDYAKKIFHNAIRHEAWLDENLIGLIAIYYNIFDQKFGYITNISIQNKHSRNQIASTLLKTAINDAKANNLKKIELQVHKSNIPALALYKKFSFLKANEKENILLLKKAL